MAVERMSSAEVTERFAAVLAEVERTGKTVIITVRGRDVAHLTPAHPPRRFPRTAHRPGSGQLSNLAVPTDFDAPLPNTELDRWDGGR
jgi:prevent-host-death family protein